MAISPISPIAAVPMPQVPAVRAAAEGDGDSFADMIGRALETVSASNQQADVLAVQAATGDLESVHDYTIAATEAQLLTQLTVEVRNRAVEAFNDIMRMQV